MTTDELLVIVKGRGLAVFVAADGSPRLRGKIGEVNEPLLKALKIPVHREEIIRRFKPVRRVVVLKAGDDSEVEEILVCEPITENLRAACRERPGKMLALEAWTQAVVKPPCVACEALFRDGRCSNCGRADGYWVRFGWCSWPKCDDPVYYPQPDKRSP